MELFGRSNWRWITINLDGVHSDSCVLLIWTHPNIQTCIVHLNETQLSRWTPMDHLWYVNLDRPNGRRSNGPRMLHKFGPSNGPPMWCKFSLYNFFRFFSYLQHPGLIKELRIEWSCKTTHSCQHNHRSIRPYDKKPAGCYKWNSPCRQTDYTQLTDSVQMIFLGKFKRSI